MPIFLSFIFLSCPAVGGPVYPAYSRSLTIPGSGTG